MGRRESIAGPTVAGRAYAPLAANLEFAAVQLQVRSLMQEARVLREEATALREGPHRFGDQIHRCGVLHRQALLCSTEAMELMRVACRVPGITGNESLTLGSRTADSVNR